MLRFEHNFVIIRYSPIHEKYWLCNFACSAIVLDIDALKNAQLNFEFMTSLNNTEQYDSVEEAQMNAAIQGYIDYGEHIPVLSTMSSKKFTTITRIFPVNANTARETLKSRINELDMFKVIEQ